MTKAKILEVLYQMLIQWESAYKSPDPNHMVHIEVQAGFCYYLYFGMQPKIAVLQELTKEKPETTVKGFWYEIFDTNQNREAFLPRINHLNKTIARLETEVASNIETVI